MVQKRFNFFSRSCFLPPTFYSSSLDWTVVWADGVDSGDYTEKERERGIVVWALWITFTCSGDCIQALLFLSTNILIKTGV
jgi:hypothetical protein